MGFAEQAERQVRIGLPKRVENFRQERGHDEAARRGLRLQGVKQGVLETGDLDLDVEECAGLVAGENLLECGKVGEFCGLRVGDHNALKARVVADDGVMIRALPDIEFKSVTAMFDREVEGEEGIFRNRPSGASAAVAEE